MNFNNFFLYIAVFSLDINGHAKFMGYTGPVQMGYGARTFSAHINNGAGTFL